MVATSTKTAKTTKTAHAAKSQEKKKRKGMAPRRITTRLRRSYMGRVKLQAARTNAAWDSLARMRSTKNADGLPKSATQLEVENRGAVLPARRALSLPTISTVVSGVAAKMESELQSTSSCFLQKNKREKLDVLPVAPMQPTFSAAFANRLEFLTMQLAKELYYRAHAVTYTMAPKARRVSPAVLAKVCETVAKQLADTPAGTRFVPQPPAQKSKAKA
jgi:hypothetical protein